MIVLLSRLDGFAPVLGEELLHPGATFFEHWGHEASWIPLELYPALAFRRREFRRHPRWVTSTAGTLTWPATSAAASARRAPSARATWKDEEVEDGGTSKPPNGWRPGSGRAANWRFGSGNIFSELTISPSGSFPMKFGIIVDALPAARFRWPIRKA